MGDGGLYDGNVGLKLRIRASWGRRQRGDPVITVSNILLGLGLICINTAKPSFRWQ